VAASFAAPTFVTIVDPSKLKLLAYIDEFDVALIKADQQVTFTADALPSETFAGVIRAVNPQAVIRDNVTNYVANVELVAGSTDRLRPDMSVDVVIETGLRSRFLIIPESAVVREGEKTYVYVRQATRLEKRRVQLGDAAGEGLRVREGITDGEMVVLNPDVVTQ
jgi:hypothetical protein